MQGTRGPSLIRVSLNVLPLSHESRTRSIQTLRKGEAARVGGTVLSSRDPVAAGSATLFDPQGGVVGDEADR